MAWFKRKDKGIQTPTEAKKDIPKGLWYKSPTGKIVDTEELEQNYYVSPEDGYHVRIGSKEYFDILFDDKFKELDANLTSKDPLKFSMKAQSLHVDNRYIFSEIYLQQKEYWDPKGILDDITFEQILSKDFEETEEITNWFKKLNSAFIVLFGAITGYLISFI